MGAESVSANSAGTPAPTDVPVSIGVGIDTSRYGHYASFLLNWLGVQ